ncbi:SPFH domain-containing protein [Nocardia asteroides]|uniref:SPFH domain-containing protein n=1 Tax=Nocardia asteroides TaxID=1824 RepID=UPI001E40E217|nr:SPFH domain-containing protein [Nocardia asteroides]UGT63330.1 SPFH domain-containing protein [Nocardia asteroides]
MAWLAREFIAVPENRKNQLVYKWPDVTIRRYSRAIVNADELALVVRSGQVLATLGPGRHRIDAVELPVLGALLDGVTGGNLYRAELYFVAAREVTGLRFGGRLADVRDPVSEQVVTLRAFGEFALAVRDPAVLITALTGTTDLTDPAAVTSWAAELLLKSMKVAVARGVSGGQWPVLGLSEQLRPIEAAVLRETNLALYEYGLRIPRMGNFDITLAPEDAERLKRLAKDITYIRLAGDFQRYAAGELALGAGQGLAHGGGGGAEGGLLGAALGLAALQQPRVVPPAMPEPAVGCGGCGAAAPAGARFCPGCGARLAAAPRHCPGCGAEAAPGARFCAACGAGLPG